MIAIVKVLEEMPSYLRLSFIGRNERGTYGFTIGMQKKMGREINVQPADKMNYDYIDDDGYMYRKDWLKSIRKGLMCSKNVKKRGRTSELLQWRA